MQELANGSPLISVIIPAYNAATYIERTLHTVLTQTYRQIEIIVVNDGSSDETEAIVLHMAKADARLRVISIPNGGVARARNHGIALSRGGFVAFIDADDLWRADKLEKQLDQLNRHGPDYGAVYTLHYVIDETDRVLRPGDSVVATGYILNRHLVLRLIGNGSTLLVRREALLSTRLFDPTYADDGIGGCEDLDLELQLAEKFKFAAVPERLVGYRVYDGNMSSNRPRMARSLIETNKRAVMRCSSFLSQETQRQIRISQHRSAFEGHLTAGLVEGTILYGRLYFQDDPLGAPIFTLWKFAYSLARILRRALRPTNPQNRTLFEDADIHFSVRSGGPSSLYSALENEDKIRESVSASAARCR